MSTVVTLRGPVCEAALARVHADVAELLGRGEHVVLVVSHCDLTVVDAVCRIRLLAGAVEVVGADPELFEACGLRDVL